GGHAWPAGLAAAGLAPTGIFFAWASGAFGSARASTPSVQFRGDMLHVDVRGEGEGAGNEHRACHSNAPGVRPRGRRATRVSVGPGRMACADSACSAWGCNVRIADPRRARRELGTRSASQRSRREVSEQEALAMYFNVGSLDRALRIAVGVLLMALVIV